MQAMFGPRIQHAIYWLNPASAQDTSFYHNQKKKKRANGLYGAIKLKKAIVLPHGQKSLPHRDGCCYIAK